MNREGNSGKVNTHYEKKINEAHERIIYLEEKIDGPDMVKKQPPEFSLKAIRNELMKGFEDRTKGLESKHEEIEESKAGLEKRIKALERKIREMDEQHQQSTLEFKQELMNMNGISDPTATKDLEKKMQQLDQKRRKDNQSIQDELMDLGKNLRLIA